MVTVCVFMSTYNGEIYLREQLDSIMRQKGVEVLLYIRDDGSTDDTIQIIEEYINKGENIVIKQGKNVGFEKSFAFISREHVEADYYAFADQDDVWKQGKLIRAVKKMSEISGPVLYGGNILVADAKLQNETKWAKNDMEFQYRKSTVQNCYALGYNTYACSMIWNKELQMLVERHMPQYFISHDVYLTMLAGATGYLLVDEEPMIWHRIHGNNTAGIEKNPLKKIKKGYALYWGKDRRRLSRVAREIIENYADRINKGKPSVGLLYDVAKCPKSRKARLRLLRSSEIKLLNRRSRLLAVCFICGNKI